MFRDSRITIITNFVVLSSVGIKRVVCIFICLHIYIYKLRNFAKHGLCENLQINADFIRYTSGVNVLNMLVHAV